LTESDVENGLMSGGWAKRWLGITKSMTYQRIIERNFVSLLTSKLYHNGNDDRVVIDFFLLLVPVLDSHTEQSHNKTAIKPPSSSGSKTHLTTTMGINAESKQRRKKCYNLASGGVGFCFGGDDGVWSLRERGGEEEASRNPS
jgi:hypothetical protein